MVIASHSSFIKENTQWWPSIYLCTNIKQTQLILLFSVQSCFWSIFQSMIFQFEFGKICSTVLFSLYYICICDISFRLLCLAINDCSLKLALWISMLGMNFDARNVPILMLEMNFSAYNLEFQYLQSTLIISS